MAKVILTVIDGCRLDACEQATTPNLDRLRAEGFFARARSVIPPLTLPVHFSIFSGLTPVNHGVLTNTASPAPSRAAVGLIDWAKIHGLSTAALYNWEHLRNLSTPGSLDYALCLDCGEDENTDDRLTTAALDLIRSAAPDFIFLYLGRLDAIGHAHGWMSAEYLDGLEEADTQVGRVMDLVFESRPEDGYHLVVLSDHGGEGNNHEEPLAQVLTVPWLAAGPDLVRGVEADGEISLLDAAPTLARLLELPPLPGRQGRVVEESLRPKARPVTVDFTPDWM